MLNDQLSRLYNLDFRILMTSYENEPTFLKIAQELGT